jgi:hypothetical protein
MSQAEHDITSDGVQDGNVNGAKMGGYLMFHMDHAGVSGDVEMQAVLQYDVV